MALLGRVELHEESEDDLAEELAILICTDLDADAGKFFAENPDLMDSDSNDSYIMEMVNQYKDARLQCFELMFGFPIDASIPDREDRILDKADNLVIKHFSNISSPSMH